MRHPHVVRVGEAARRPARRPAPPRPTARAAPHRSGCDRRTRRPGQAGFRCGRRPARAPGPRRRRRSVRPAAMVARARAGRTRRPPRCRARLRAPLHRHRTAVLVFAGNRKQNAHTEFQHGVQQALRTRFGAHRNVGAHCLPAAHQVGSQWRSACDSLSRRSVGTARLARRTPARNSVFVGGVTPSTISERTLGCER